MLSQQFKNTFNALCSSEPNVAKDRIPLALSILDGGALPTAEMEDRILKPAEVAKMIGRTRRTVDDLCRRGFFKKVVFGKKHSLGILASSVVAGIQAGASKPGRRPTKCV